MRAVILLIAIATTAAELPSSTEPVPVVLGDATPADVLMYLYDVALKAYMNRDANRQGFSDTKRCAGDMYTFNGGSCAPYTEPPSLHSEYFATYPDYGERKR